MKSFGDEPCLMLSAAPPEEGTGLRHSEAELAPGSLRGLRLPTWCLRSSPKGRWQQYSVPGLPAQEKLSWFRVGPELCCRCQGGHLWHVGGPGCLPGHQTEAETAAVPLNASWEKDREGIFLINWWWIFWKLLLFKMIRYKNKHWKL